RAAGTAQAPALLETGLAGVGIVEEEEELRPPHDRHRVAGVENQPDGDAQRLWPALGRTQGMALPVEGPDFRSHLAAAGEEARSVASHSRLSSVDALVAPMINVAAANPFLRTPTHGRCRIPRTLLVLATGVQRETPSERWRETMRVM